MVTAILGLIAAVAFGLYIIESMTTGKSVPLMDTVVFSLLSAITWKLIDIEKQLKNKT